MDRALVLKAIADETRMKILLLLLKHSYCVRALARKLELSEGAISQQLKVLREAGLLTGEKKGYFMHYDVNRDELHALAADIEALASIEREVCIPEEDDSHMQKQNCSEEVKAFCHGSDFAKGEKDHEHPGHCY